LQGIDTRFKSDGRTVSVQFLLISLLHIVPVAYDWTLHDLPVLAHPLTAEEDKRRWLDFLSFVAVTFFIAGIYTFSEINLATQLTNTEWALLSLGGLLGVCGFFTAALRTVFSENFLKPGVSMPISNNLVKSRSYFGGRTGLLWRTALFAFLFVLIVSRGYWVQIIAPILTP
jgi:hypothetical protein